MTTTDRDVADHHAAGSLADELPYWGWLPDDRTCLTRRGELVTLARLTPTVVDGHTPEQLDAVLGRWQRMLSGIDARTRIYFYLLRRPAIFPDADTGLSAVADLGQRKRRAFLASRIQQIETFLAWCYDPKLSTAAHGKGHQPWWKNYLATWAQRKRNPNEAIYFREQIEDAAARFRQQVDASRTLVADLTPLDILNAQAGSRLLAELVNKPGRPPWEGATGSGLNWRLAYSELEAERRHLAARRRARDSLLARVPAGQGDRQPPERPVPARQRDDRLARMAPVGSRRGAAQDPRRAAPLLFQTLFDDGPRAGDGRHGHRDGGQRGRRGIRPFGECPRRTRNRRRGLWRPCA